MIQASQMIPRFYSNVLWLVLIGMLSSPAYALFDAQLLVGQRYTKFEASTSDNMNASEVTLAVHVDPIPLVPVAFGLSYVIDNYKTSTSNAALPLESFKGQFINFEAMAWTPLDLFDLTPYAKLQYALWGQFDGENNNFSSAGTSTTSSFDARYDISGYQLGLGLRWSPLALVSGLLELGLAKHKIKEKSVKIAGSDSNDLTTFNANSTVILIGVEVGL